MSKKTYTYLEPGSVEPKNKLMRSIVFVNTEDFNSRMSLNCERVKAQNNGVSIEQMRVGFLLTNKSVKQDLTCVDAKCVPHGSFPRNIRVTFSGPIDDAELLVQELEELMAYIKVDTRWRKALLPASSSDITLGTA